MRSLRQVGRRVVLRRSPSAAALAGEGPNLVGTFKDWHVYSAGKGKNRTCYALTVPKEMNPANVTRDEVFFLISNWPANKTVNQPSIVPGYQYARERQGPGPGWFGQVCLLHQERGRTGRRLDGGGGRREKARRRHEARLVHDRDRHVGARHAHDATIIPWRASRRRWISSAPPANSRLRFRPANVETLRPDAHLWGRCARYGP